MYLIRLDDACEYMDVERWQRVEDILNERKTAPLVGIIPDCRDKSFTSKYVKDENFWSKAGRWRDSGWIIGLHGCTHVYETKSGGINPVHCRSEFANLPLEVQKEKIRLGYNILKAHSLEPKIFFAPSHTFDLNTLEAVKSETGIRIISDTVANKIYKKHGLYFLPQQSGKCRNLPFKFTTIALHPNTMEEKDFQKLKEFVAKNESKLVKNFEDIKLSEKKYSLYDLFLSALYFLKRKLH